MHQERVFDLLTKVFMTPRTIGGSAFHLCVSSGPFLSINSYLHVI